MEACKPVSSWTEFSEDCPAVAACVKFSHNTPARCDCTHSALFLANGSNNNCDATALTHVFGGFWAAVGLLCVFVGFRMWRSMAVPQPSTEPGSPKQRSGQFQRCKWINLASIVWTAVWCFVRASHALALPSKASSNALVHLEFVAHSVLFYLFLFSVVDLSAILVVVLLCASRLKSANFGATTPMQKLLSGGGAALVLVSLVIIPDALHLPSISMLVFALEILGLVGVFCFVLRMILDILSSKRTAVVATMQPIFISCKCITLTLVCCFVGSLALSVVEFLVRTWPTLRGLRTARFVTTVIQHLAIVAFQFLVTLIANGIQIKRRQSLEDSGSVARRGSKDSRFSFRSYRSNTPKELNSARSLRSTRSSAPPVAVFTGDKVEPRSMPIPRRATSCNSVVRKTSITMSVTESATTSASSIATTASTSSSAQDMFLSPPGSQSVTLPVRPSPLRNIALRASGSSGDESN